MSIKSSINDVSNILVFFLLLLAIITKIECWLVFKQDLEKPAGETIQGGGGCSVIPPPPHIGSLHNFVWGMHTNHGTTWTNSPFLIHQLDVDPRKVDDASPGSLVQICRNINVHRSKYKSKFNFDLFGKKIKFWCFHGVVLVKTFPLMYQLLM